MSHGTQVNINSRAILNPIIPSSWLAEAASSSCVLVHLRPKADSLCVAGPGSDSQWLASSRLNLNAPSPKAAAPAQSDSFQQQQDLNLVVPKVVPLVEVLLFCAPDAQMGGVNQQTVQAQQ